MADSDFDKITPADINLSGTSASAESAESSTPPPLGVEEIRRSDEEKKKHTLILGGIFGLLLVLVGGVVFVLPRFISPPEPAASRVVVVDPQPDKAAPANTVSPFDEAQKLRQREAAQNVLAELLDLQESLEGQEAQTWAADEFSSVFSLAAQGDEAYRNQDFVDAREYYQQGLDILKALDASLPQVFEEYMARGNQAILDGDAELAESSFSVAVLVNPDSSDAVTGLDRSQLLEEVLGLLSRGQALHEEGQLEEARDFYREALAIDPVHESAAEWLTRANNDILDRDFSATMSRGFTALAADNPEEAEAAFRDALGLKPNSPEASTALEQTISAMTLSAINVHLRAADNYVQQEQWATALAEYEAALEIDANVVSAREGRSQANSRHNLDNYLETINNDPLRLAEDSVYQQAVGIYNEAVKITGDWPRLAGQLSTMRRYLERATEPVTVQLQSDGLTSVTVYTIGELGQFTDQTLNLTPGAYVAVGVREGFRDVREEFVVGFNGESPRVTIQCTEEIL